MPSQLQGHRERLRQRFVADPASLIDQDLLELLLTYAIPQRDVAPAAQALIQRFGSLAAALDAPFSELTEVAGIGDYTAVLLQVVQVLKQRPDDKTAESLQPTLIESVVAEAPAANREPVEPASSAAALGGDESVGAPGRLRAFVNDEIVHSQEFMPLVHRFSGYDEFRSYLGEQLPYNAASTRKRRANHILNRFFPNGRWDRTLVEHLKITLTPRSRDAVLFYHIARTELLLRKVAEEFVWPALAQGQVTREEMRAFVLRLLPDLSASSQANVLRSIFNAYNLLGIATEHDDVLHLRLQPGHLDSFVYVLASEFPKPGIYRFDQLEQGPMRKWLLWDKEWIRRQLYLLREAGVIAKVSEIDAWRQWTLSYEQQELLRAYLKLDRQELTLREQADATETQDF